MPRRRGGPINKNSVSYKNRQMQVNKALSEWAKDIEKQVRAQAEGIVERMGEAVEVVKQESLEMTPRDMGELQDSAYTDVQRDGNEVIGIIGYTADHAVYTHEIPYYHGQDKYPNNPPRAQYKYLETAIKNKKDEVLNILSRKR